MKKIMAYIIYLSHFGIPGIAQLSGSFNIHCSINGKEKISIFRNEPLLIDVKVYNGRAQAALRWNMADERRIENLNDQLKQGRLTEEDYNGQKREIEKDKRQTEVITIGDSENTWTSRIRWTSRDLINERVANLPLRLLTNSTNPGMVKLDGNSLFVGILRIDPGQLQSVTPGRYEIIVIINETTSNSVILNILPGTMPAVMAQSEKFLLQTGRYYWESNNPTQTLLYAGKALAKNPGSIKALVLKGDGLVLEKSFALALETYGKAISQYYILNGENADPPEYLLAMIHHLKKEMGQWED